MFSWFNSQDCELFGRELSDFVLSELSSRAADKSSKKFTLKAQKSLSKVDSKIQVFKQTNSLNFYKKSKLANAFLWALKDSGCDAAYAKELTEWLTARL